jgi:hypothetical protein
MIYELEGKQYEVPDGTTLDELNDFIGSQGQKTPSDSSEKPKMTASQLQDILNPITGDNRSPVDTARDITYASLVGLGKGGQSAAQFLYGGGENKSLPKNAGFGAGQTPVSLQQIGAAQPKNDMPSMNMEKYFSSVASPNKSIGGEILKSTMQVLPYLPAGGANAFGQIAASTAGAGLTADEDQQNLLGFLPSGRKGAVYENVLLSMLGLGTVKGIPKAINAVSSKKDINKLLSSISTPVESKAQGNPWEGDFKPASSRLPTGEENIEEMSKRAQLGKESALQEALVPKEELYSQEGKSNVYKIPKEQLPEGNIGQLSAMFSDGEKFNPTQMKSMDSALKKYRKTGNIGDFIEEGKDVFNAPELPEGHENKIENTLLMPTERDSNYLSDKNVTKFYPEKGMTKQLHDKYAKKSTLNNYDKLQSNLKSRQRTLQKRYDNGTIGDVAEAELNQLNSNISNLDKDQEMFSKSLPEKLHNLDKEWRTKYAKNVRPFLDNPTLEKLSSGDWQEVKPNEVENAFTFADDKTMKAVNEMGPSFKNNLVYNAILSVSKDDPEAIGNAILKLKNTKGYQKFITPEMEDQANKLIKKGQNPINPQNWIRLAKKIIRK